MVESDNPHKRMSLAINQWKKVINPQFILLSKEAIKPYAGNTIGIEKSIAGVLIPHSTKEVQEIVKIAQKYKTPLYPISAGKNWGYGSSLPIQDKSFIVDLSNMKRIIDFDPELGSITVEPGVTQQDLYEYLMSKGDEFMVPTTGAGPTASILGNALERGYGLTPHSDHFEAITSFQAVLPNGELYIPALSELGGKRINKLFKWGIGPYLDGIFTQGNFGIVTQGSLLLARRPEHISTFFFSLKKDISLEGAIKAIREIKDELGSSVGAINLMNARRILSMLVPYPEDELKNNQIISDEKIAIMAKSHSLTEWTGLGAIYGRKEVVKAMIKIIKKKLKPHCKRIHFFSKRKIKIATYSKYLLPVYYQNIIKPKLEILNSALDNISGVPNQVALPLAYWKSNTNPSETDFINPSKDNCGLLWHSPLIPLASPDIRKHIEIVNQVCPKYNINPLITLTIFSAQCCDSTIPIIYSKENLQNKIDAKACHDELIQLEQKEGYLPYRLGIDKMNQLIEPKLPCWELANNLKKSIDANQIIAPGRYVPYQEQSVSIKDTPFAPNNLESILV